MTKACCPGSFDPPTNGHIDIIQRATRMFDEVVVAVIVNPSKRGMFTTEERIDMLREVTSDLDGVKVASFEGLTVDFCKREGCEVIVKGLRAGDLTYEMQMAQMNGRMGVDTVFLATDPAYAYVSSSLMKEVISLGGSIDGLVPDRVLERLEKKVKR